jgi:peptidoglycan/LPS O-acetylase OafA/YrhL
MGDKRIASLDGIRAVAVALVIVGHLAGHSATLYLGVFGVQIFFVLSGYLITRLLLEERRRDGVISLRDFYRRRCWRILPAAYAYILIVTVISGSRSGWGYALTYTTPYSSIPVAAVYGHLWSLSIEEQFYLLWPLALVLCFGYRRGFAISSILLAAAFRVYVTMHGHADIAHTWFPGTMDGLAIGCLLAVHPPKQLRVSPWILAVAAWGVFALCLRTGVFGAALFGLSPILMALSLAGFIERSPAVLNNHAAVFLGALSYSLYLWQQPFTALYRNGWPLFISLLMLFACAAASHLFIEKPLIARARNKRHLNTAPALSHSYSEQPLPCS